MAITPDQYPLLVAAPMLQDYLVDKDLGTPLAGGIVTFYHDNDRLRLKTLYMQTGTPGDYTYVELENPMHLSSVGTMTDSQGNDIIPFYYPYDEDDSTILDPYYVTVYSVNQDGSPAALQFTRENFPFVNPSTNPSDDQLDLQNLIPNGQFSAHTNLPNSGVYPNGTSSVVVAQGGSAGWYYTKDNPSSDVDIILFSQILQEPPNVTGNPRYAINISCQDATGNDTFKELRMRFNNVNRFASDTNIYTFSFTGLSNAATPLNVLFKLIKNFGTGGSATTETDLQQFTLDSGMYEIFSFSFVFGTNESFTIGSLNDDYIELAISFPSTQSFNASLTDFMLVSGQIDISQYPERPDNMVYADGIVGSIPTPNPNGSDLFLPIILTKAGVTYDHSVVGNFIASPSATLDNYLLCDGSVYLTSDFSSSGIPYSRLQTVLYSSGFGGVPLYGTGSTYATAQFRNTVNNALRIYTNQPGAQTGATDGLGPLATGFTFGNIHTGQASSVSAYASASSTINVIGNTVANVTAPTAGTTSFSVLAINTAAGGTLPMYYVFAVSTVAGASITGGQYFTFHANPGNTAFYVWFTVDGVGADPTPGGTGYQVNILSTYTAAEVASAVRESISGYQVSSVVCNAASTLVPGAYWTFSANGQVYSVSYIINGVGNQDPVGAFPIPIFLTGTETADQVATGTLSAINNAMFAVPDLRGAYLIGNRGSGQYDTNAAIRLSGISGYFGNNVGTFQNSMAYTNDAASSGSQRGSELNNSSINWFIRL